MSGTTEIGVGFTKMTVIRRVANAAGVEGTDFLMPGEIRAELAKSDPETSALLQLFLEAVDRWFLINRLVERRMGQDSQLDDEHVTAVARRAAAQAQLEKRLRFLETGRSSYPS